MLVGAIDYSAAVAALARPGRLPRRDRRRARGVRALGPLLARRRRSTSAGPAPAIDERALGPRDAVIVFSHDPKFDEPAILAALRSDAGYIGALGSRRTARDRSARLLAAGADAEALARVHSPCGLDIGAATPEEVAISIMAEVIAARSGRAGEPLVSDARARSARADAQLLGGVDVEVGAEAVAGDEPHGGAGEQARARPRRRAGRRRCSNSARSSSTGWPGRPAVASRGPRAAPSRAADDAVDRARVDRRAGRRA